MHDTVASGVGLRGSTVVAHLGCLLKGRARDCAGSVVVTERRHPSMEAGGDMAAAGGLVRHLDRLPGPRVLRAFRQISGLTQEELAERSGLSVRSVRSLELGGVTKPRRSTLTCLSAAMALTPQDAELLSRWSASRPDPLETSALHDHDAEPGDHVLYADLFASSTRFDVVAVSEHVALDAGGRVTCRLTDEAVVATADLVESRQVLYMAQPGETLVGMEVECLEGCRVAGRRYSRDRQASVVTFALDPPLRRGASRVLKYAARFPAQGEHLIADQRVVIGFLAPPHTLVVRLGFDPGRLPENCHRVEQASPHGTLRTVAPVPIGRDGCAHLALANPKPGGHGLVWQFATG